MCDCSIAHARPMFHLQLIWTNKKPKKNLWRKGSFMYFSQISYLVSWSITSATANFTHFCYKYDLNSQHCRHQRMFRYLPLVLLQTFPQFNYVLLCFIQKNLGEFGLQETTSPILTYLHFQFIQYSHI